jgi:hypothetical protein
MSFRDALKDYQDDSFSFWGIYPAPFFRNHIDHSHLRLWEIYALFPRIFHCAREYNSLIFVRNPYVRFLSALNEHMKKFQPQIDLAQKTPAERVAIMEAFVAKALNIARITTDWRFVHFSPQIWFLRLGDEQVPKNIVAMGGGDDFMAAGLRALELPDEGVPWVNPSPVDLSGALDSRPIVEFVENFYADDFAFFRAAPALSHLAERADAENWRRRQAPPP